MEHSSEKDIWKEIFNLQTQIMALTAILTPDQFIEYENALTEKNRLMFETFRASQHNND